jgi:hypothetical protein
MPRRIGRNEGEGLGVNVTETRVEKPYKDPNEKDLQKREVWSAYRLSLFHKEGWKNRPLILCRAKANELQLTHVLVEIEQDRTCHGKDSLWQYAA